jgi:uncharacterized protein (TIGR02996 family)
LRPEEDLVTVGLSASPQLALLHRAILLAPEDDLPRRMLADCLEEEGGEAELARAAFIRVQVELHRRRDEYDSYDLMERGPSYNALRRRERELFTWGNIERWFTHGPWLRTFTDGGEYERCEVGHKMLTRRGFVESITLPLAAFQGHAAALFAAQPITAVRLGDREPRENGLREKPWFWVTTADFGDEPNHLPRDLRPLPGCAWMDLGPAPQWDTQGHYYSSADAAHAALSAACVRRGRLLAGLPPLP